jgi:radical SAM-linked protein
MRIRITFTKQGALRYTGHLDLHKIWERATRRANLPLAYSQGFHPQPKIQLAAALPLGFSSRCELVDMWVEDDALDLTALPARFGEAVPLGIKILGVEKVEEKSPPLQTQVVSAEYEVTLFDEIDLDGLTQRLDSVMEKASLPRERRGKPYDLRPLIEELSLIPSPLPVGEGQRVRVFMRLAAREGATGRPEEVLDVLGIRYEGTRVERSRFLFKETL